MPMKMFQKPVRSNFTILVQFMHDFDVELNLTDVELFSNFL